MLNKNKALVVLSGGQDSTTCLFWAIKQGYEVHAITFDYGQSHSIELDAALRVACRARNSSGQPIPVEIVTLPGILKSSSPLTNDGKDLKRYEDFNSMEEEVGDKVEATFVPMRNTFFLTVAANRAVALGAGTIVTGVCQGDNANYPDCTEEFIRKLSASFNQSLGFKYNDMTGDYPLEIATPLMHLSKAETVKLSKDLKNGCWEALAYSHTSYDGKYPPTDNNHSNLLRAQGFAEAGEPDPLVVRAWYEGLMHLPATANYNEIRDVVDAMLDRDEYYNRRSLQEYLSL